jgi:thiamine pyrophosphate-dependent acetolactate synthase large subunit-like protein
MSARARRPVADPRGLDRTEARPTNGPPDPEDVARAVAAIRAAKRPLVVSGRGARGTGTSVAAFLEASDALYLDTQESRGLVPADHPAVVGAVRAAAMAQADLVVTLGRKLDYQLGFGSPAVFPQARFLRISDTAGELIDNRRGVEILAPVGVALDAITEALGNDAGARDQGWLDGLRKSTARASRRARTRLRRRLAGMARSTRSRSSRRSARSPIPTMSQSPTAATS